MLRQAFAFAALLHLPFVETNQIAVKPSYCVVSPAIGKISKSCTVRIHFFEHPKCSRHFTQYFSTFLKATSLPLHSVIDLIPTTPNWLSRGCPHQRYGRSDRLKCRCYTINQDGIPATTLEDSLGFSDLQPVDLSSDMQFAYEPVPDMYQGSTVSVLWIPRSVLEVLSRLQSITTSLIHYTGVINCRISGLTAHTFYDAFALHGDYNPAFTGSSHYFHPLWCFVLSCCT